MEGQAVSSNKKSEPQSLMEQIKDLKIIDTLTSKYQAARDRNRARQVDTESFIANIRTAQSKVRQTHRDLEELSTMDTLNKHLEFMKFFLIIEIGFPTLFWDCLLKVLGPRVLEDKTSDLKTLKEVEAQLADRIGRLEAEREEVRDSLNAVIRQMQELSLRSQEETGQSGEKEGGMVSRAEEEPAGPERSPGEGPQEEGGTGDN